jgi:hypothetical protein
MPATAKYGHVPPLLVAECLGHHVAIVRTPDGLRPGSPHARLGFPAGPREDGCRAEPFASVPAARPLAASGRSTHAPGMFVVSEAEAAAIRAAFDQGGEFSAAVELRRLFPGVLDNRAARDWARTIAGWRPLGTLTPRD